MMRFEYRQLLLPVVGGIQLYHCVWDNLLDRVHSKLNSRYACKVYINEHQEVLEEDI